MAHTPDLPSQDQLDRLARRLHPLFFKLSGAQPEQKLEIKFFARPNGSGVTLRMEVKLDGEDLPPEQEAKIEEFLLRVWQAPV